MYDVAKGATYQDRAMKSDQPLLPVILLAIIQTPQQPVAGGLTLRASTEKRVNIPAGGLYRLCKGFYDVIRDQKYVFIHVAS